MISANEVFGGATAAGAARVLVVDADCALIELLDEWLGALGCSVVHDADVRSRERFDLVIVDVPYPRQGGIDLLRQVASMHPTTPILALSSAFFAKTDCCGAVARALGVASVCPKPVSREVLSGAVRRLVRTAEPGPP